MLNPPNIAKELTFSIIFYIITDKVKNVKVLSINKEPDLKNHI